MSTETPQATEKKPLNLSIDVKEESACERHVTVTIPRDDIESYFDTVSYTHLTLPTILLV